MLQTAKIAAVRAVVTAAPDRALQTLDSALRADGGSGPAALVRELIETELSERAVRDGVFAPLLALCSPPRHSVGAQLFPPRTPARLWAALKVMASEDTQVLLAGGDTNVEAVQNRLCLRAAASLRAGEPAVVSAVDGLSPAALSSLALALELAPLARATMAELPNWFARATGAHVASMRLTYKDAGRLGDGSGPLLIEALLAGVDEPWRILRLIGWVMDRPDERYLAKSELAGVTLRLLGDIDVAVAVVKDADFSSGSEAGMKAARALEQGLATVAAAESAFALKRGPWAERVRRNRNALIGFAEARLREAEALVNASLPPPPMKLAGRLFGGGGARYTAAPEPALLARGQGLLTFLSETHAAADIGGFAALWAKTAKSVDDRLAGAADELIAMLQAGWGETGPVQGCLEAAAELTSIMQGAQAGGHVRRRAAAA